MYLLSRVFMLLNSEGIDCPEYLLIFVMTSILEMILKKSKCFMETCRQCALLSSHVPIVPVLRVRFRLKEVMMY